MQFINLLSSPNGKITRLKFLISHISILLISALFVFLPSLISAISAENTDSTSNFEIFTAGCFVIAVAFCLYSTFCISIKRIRDIGLSPWFVLLLLVPLVGLIAYLFLLFYPRLKTKSLSLHNSHKSSCHHFS